MLSIDAQLRELKEFAVKEKLEIIEVFSEAKSAKAPGRKVFNQMLEALKQGQADGILVWNPDRLSRNSRDGGEIIFLIDQGYIKDLKFPTYFYDSSPHGKFNLSLAFGFSKLFLDNLVQNVKRGIREKIKRCEFPGLPPRGYLNNPKTRAIDAHPEYFDLVRVLLEKFALGKITISEIRDRLFQNGITTRSGEPIHHSTVTDMLRNPFYYGVFRLKGELYSGSHPAMISKETFDQIQYRLDDHWPVVKSSEEQRKQKGFLFDEPAKCGECGHAITREYHKKASGLEFRYYRCTRKSKTCNCKQKPINEKDLANQVESLLSEIALNDDWYEWSMDIITGWKQEEEANLDEQLQEFKTIIAENETKLERLLDLYIEGGLTNDEYKYRKNKLINSNTEIQDKISQLESQASYKFEPLALALKTSNQAFHAISSKNYSQMFQILKSIGLNRKLLDKKLNLDLVRPYCFFRESVSGLALLNSPETSLQNKNQQSQARSGVKGYNEGSGEAGTLVVSRQALSLGSAQTEVKPFQSASSERAVGTATLGSTEGREQVAKRFVRAAGNWLYLIKRKL